MFNAFEAFPILEKMEGIEDNAFSDQTENHGLHIEDQKRKKKRKKPWKKWVNQVCPPMWKITALRRIVFHSPFLQRCDLTAKISCIYFFIIEVRVGWCSEQPDLVTAVPACGWGLKPDEL